MAEKTAHLTTNLTSKPSIFEVVASDSLLSTFYPAFKRIANVSCTPFILSKITPTLALPFQFLVLRNPERFKYLGRFYDEIYLVCNALIQNHYLKNHGDLLDNPCTLQHHSTPSLLQVAPYLRYSTD